MPELPDLQAFSYTLSKQLVGKRVEKVHAIHTRKLNVTEKELRNGLEGARLDSVFRDGKRLHFMFDNGNVLGLHMMLKGELQFFTDKNEAKFAILEIVFSGGTGLALCDWQRQATATLNPEADTAPDALAKSVNVKFLRECLSSSKATIKKLLMDQNVIRGIGNAYADEILWDARISPFSISHKVPEEAIKRLAGSIRSVLTRAEKSIRKTHPGIIGGEVRDFMAVHRTDRTESPTGGTIHIASTGGRKTYYTDEQILYC